LIEWAASIYLHPYLPQWMFVPLGPALRITLLGATIVFTALKQVKLTRISGLVVLGMGLTGLILHGMQKAAEPNLLFTMAFSSAIGFTALGMALICYSLDSWTFSAMAAIFATVPTALGVVTAMSFALDLGWSWNIASLSQMPFISAVDFTLIGAFFLTDIIRNLHQNSLHSFRTVPLATTSVLLVAFVSLWQILISHEQTYIREMTEVEGENIKTEVQQTMAQITLALQRFASRVEYLGTRDQVFLNLDAQSYLEHIPILRRVGVVDSHFKVGWSYPLDMASQIRGYDQHHLILRAEAFDAARELHKPILSRHLELRSGGMGFLLPVPLFRKNQFQGFIYGTLSAEQLFAHIQNPRNFDIVVREAGILLSPNHLTADNLTELTHQTHLEVSLGQWDFEITPTAWFISENHSWIPSVVLVVGVLISFLLGGLLQIIALSRQNAKRLSQQESLLNLRLNIALNTSQIGAWSLDLQTGDVWRSQNHDEIFGYSTPVKNWDRATFLEHVIPEDRERAASEQADLLKSNKNDLFRTSVQFRRAGDPSVRWLKIFSQVVRDVDNRPKQLIGVIRDFTAEKLEEVDRQASFEWRKAMLNSANYAIISTDHDGIIQTFNSAAERMLGYSGSEVIGKVSPAIFHDANEVIARAHTLSIELNRPIEPGFEVFVAKAKDYHIADENEWTYIRKDQSRFPADISVTVLADPSGNISGYLAVAIDLTEIKKTQEQLEVAHERLARVIGATESGVWERDFSTKVVQFIDNQGKHLYGFRPEEQPTFDQISALVHPDDRARLTAALEDHVAQKSNRFDLEYRVLSRSGIGPTR
jgi:PAS domain S-box-containing protein